MLNILKRKKTIEPNSPSSSEEPEKKGFFSRLKAGLSKTRNQLSTSLTDLFQGEKVLDQNLLNHIETELLTADVGIEATEQLIQLLSKKLSRDELCDTHAALALLKVELKSILKPCEGPLTLPSTTKPFVILVVGVNGSGKTTTIGKLAHYYNQDNKKILLAAGDTFRAAAVEQLKIWGERNEVPVIAQQSGADTAAVIFDALEAAKARETDLLIADTAGRLHTQSNLMEELKKIKRVLSKIDSNAPHEILLVLDASIGQNALVQAMQFHHSIGVTGLVVTKLDGTAKGGIIFAIAKKLKLPIRFIGIGEKIDDLRLFNADDFVEALFESN